MDEKHNNTEVTEETPVEESPIKEMPAYTPRPLWQVWLARIALVIFVALILIYYIDMIRG